MRNIVLNIPHSSCCGVFDNEIGRWPRNPYFVNDCVNKWTDWYTDYLFSSDKKNIHSVIFPYSRFVCDVERLENDELEKESRGIIYGEFGGIVRKELSEKIKDYLLSLRSEDLRKLSDSLTADSVLIDCHSFPSDVYNTDICIGFNQDDSYDAKLVEFVKKTFEAYDYSVELNKPYSNSITPKTDFAYKSLMIEVNKRVYLNEKNNTISLTPRKAMRWFGCMDKIYEGILDI